MIKYCNNTNNQRDYILSIKLAAIMIKYCDKTNNQHDASPHDIKFNHLSHI